MFRDCSGRFGVMPFLCSYDVTGEYGEVISNILFFPDEGEIGHYFWDIFHDAPPKSLDIRIYKNAIFRSKGKLFTEAESPHQLSRALVHSLLGVLAFIVMPLYLSN